ncbi:hypothetical protein [Motiliproteus sediminis]|uniref:hypothetical protein n=1 Tax=Motiliproteus sediminis TaxID=1468178 RepID=UPI001AEF6309|nr:hypothetical protein [Motiliproteus sediminis]
MMKTLPILSAALLTTLMIQPAMAKEDNYGQSVKKERHAMIEERKSERDTEREQAKAEKRGDDDDSSGAERRMEKKMEKNKAGRPE